MKSMTKSVLFTIFCVMIFCNNSCDLSDIDENNVQEQHHFTGDTMIEDEQEIQKAPVLPDLVQNILPGDIILFADPTTGLDLPTILMPGDFGHCGLYCGKVKYPRTIWDTKYGEWLNVGEPYMIHSSLYSTDYRKNGLQYKRFTTSERAVILRVSRDWRLGTPLSSSERERVVEWAKRKLFYYPTGQYAGPPYDINWTTKSIDGTKWYCSEIIWAAYVDELGIDLDANTSPANVGVSPTDILRSQHTSVIAAQTMENYNWYLTQNPPKDSFRCSTSMYYMIVRLNSIYYKKDKDTIGPGEMYVKVLAGDSIWGTEAAFPAGGTAINEGKIGEASDHTYSVSSGNTQSYQRYFSSVLVDGRFASIRIKAYERDPGNDDSYEPCYLTFSSSTWKSLANGNWQSYSKNVGDCTYYFQYLFARY